MTRVPIPLNTADQVPVLNLDRDQLFSDAVAASQGLDISKLALLEIPNGSGNLYNAVLLYAAHYAVDLDVDLDTDADSHPKPPAAAATGADAKDGDVSLDATGFPIVRGHNAVPVPHREGRGRLSSLWNCPDDSNGPSNYSDSDSDSDSGSDSDSSSVVEEHVAEALAAEASNSNSNRNSNSNSNSDTNVTGAANDVGKGEGEGEGDSGGGGDGDVDCKGNSKSEQKEEQQDGVLNEYASLGALRRKAEPPVQRFQMGIGYAKLRLSSATIYMHHCAYGLPVSESYVYSLQMFRTVVLASEDAGAVKELCAVALKWRSEREQANLRARPGRFSLFRFKTSGHGSGEWCNQGYKRSRPARSVILPDGQLEAIVRDIKDFVGRDTKQWYEAHGLPHRRSFLFHGPPGCGKTSTIKMIAGMFRLNACFLSLTAGDFTNQVLQDALASIPRRGLLVLEDVDVLFNEDRKSEASHALTFSGMLNALDGLISVDGIITIFTTNHIDKLDAALIRAGRVDRRFEFVHPSAKQMAALFKSFYENASPELCDRFAHIVLNRPEEEARSIATLQQHFIYTRKMSAEQSIDAIPNFFAEFYPKGGKSRNPLYL